VDTPDCLYDTIHCSGDCCPEGKRMWDYWQEQTELEAEGEYEEEEMARLCDHCGQAFADGSPHICPAVKFVPKQPPMEGLKYDGGKIEWSMLPSEPAEEIIKVYMMGAKKYGKGNYLHGIKFLRLFDAAIRHLMAWKELEDLDSESGLSHLAHAAWNVITLLEYMQRYDSFKEFDDRCAHEPLIKALQKGLKDIIEKGEDSTGTLKICADPAHVYDFCVHEWEVIGSYTDTAGTHTSRRCKKCLCQHLTHE